ncbi:39S ribosomal protein L37, mitochondrial isoform X2 [Scaptodrosophila lebanonensis]|uniref:39S ribosomal protein L37, mitochondrial isoform X2 n=1 Tax=Drosophila lebanonensis TaxID=7225 RepID=A0A6J2U3J3_DROLE|nr:39S ribosomal protein L37, mitochondrial isoform X2 [Scaptodrosophila lebanonensis]
MRPTNILYAQHIGWHFKKHWQVQGKRVHRETGAIAELLRYNLDIKSAKKVVNPSPARQDVHIIGPVVETVVENDSHQKWHNETCRNYSDSNVLLGGLAQAQVLTNTIEIRRFPRQIENAIENQQIPSAVDRRIRNAILDSHVFHALQTKLPKTKLVDRPAFNIPRTYGIASESRLLVNKLLFEIEKLAGQSVTSRRRLLDNVTLNTSLTRKKDLVNFAITTDKMITSISPLGAISDKVEGTIPDLFPMESTISIPKKHIYTGENYYSLRTEITSTHPQTVITYCKKGATNLHRSVLTPSQFESRTMLTAFAAAISRAKHLYGITTGTLQTPVVVQSVQTDGRTFHFGIFQLNTFDISSNVQNYWFHRNCFDLFLECGMKAGRPYLEGYNREIFCILNSFYHNI